MSHFHRCEGCGDPGVERGFKFCSRCCVLLDGMDLTDIIVAPPPARGREPGSDDIKPKPKHDARWLYAAVRKRNKIREAQAIGRRLKLHSNMLLWTADQVAMVTEALVAAKTPR
jgi:hypothetical protein